MVRESGNSKWRAPGRSGEKCPACGMPIPAEKVQIVREFQCPNCDAWVRTSRLFRVVLSLITLSAATVVVWHHSPPIWMRLVLWLIAWFFANAIVISIARWVIGLQFEIIHRGDEDHFTTLRLSK
jgi:predicted RNA-binding Zn-ribbon protein involved in translation (DUF1610 family)